MTHTSPANAPNGPTRMRTPSSVAMKASFAHYDPEEARV
jgi:hypothetical protein